MAMVQVDGNLMRQVVSTDYIHRPLPLDTTHSVEAMMQKARVLRFEALPVSGWKHAGLGQLYTDNSIRLFVPVETGRRATGSADDSDYAIFGTSCISLDMCNRNLTSFNRITLDVLPVCKGEGVMNLNLVIDNTPSSGLGAHLINLRNNRWNHIVYDISGVRRDNVGSLQLYTDIKGRNQFRGDSLLYQVRNLRLEYVDSEQKERGWNVADGMIAYSMSGYLPQSSKTAVLGFAAKRFCLVDAATGKCVYKGKVKVLNTTIGTFRVADFSSFCKEGTYILQCEGRATRPFGISPLAFVDSQWRVLNFIFCQRCGCDVPGIHGVCHTDMYALHDGKRVSYGGGWHDAGDLSQQTLQTADVAFALAEGYNVQRTASPQLAQRMKEESLHGYRFVLQTRFGDGWHGSSLGLLHWTDGCPNTSDDITTVRTQNTSFDNFLYAGYEAYAARVFSDDTCADELRSAALADFDMARCKYEKYGIDKFVHIMEHTYNTPRSLYMAVMSWSASQLYRLTGDMEYANLASQYIEYTLKCQATDGARPELRGYFYRDTPRLSITHFVHQSREQMYAMALAELCRTQPNSSQYQRWLTSVRLYAEYIKSIAPYTAPYGMISSGTYQTEEYRDSDGFARLNIWAPSNAPQLYEQQLRNGVRLDDRHYLRRFPIWFSIFNGNEAILLSTGKSAAVCASLLDDNHLRDIAAGQLYWTVGANPFCQSLIYGEGHRYPSMDSFSSGEIVGEMPVGIRSWVNNDEPYWPATNNACYKEVWLTSAGKWLSLLAEL